MVKVQVSSDFSYFGHMFQEKMIKIQNWL